MKKRNRDRVITVSRHRYILLSISALLIACIIGYGFNTGIRMNSRYASWIHATLEIKLEATIAHLWFEEIISGDRHENIDIVWNNLDKADQYAQAMLEGGESPEGSFVRLDDTEMRNIIIDVRNNVAKFRAVTKQRIDSINTSGPGSEIDQYYDSIFNNFVNKADQAEMILHNLMEKDLKFFRFAFLSATIFSLFIFLGLLITFRQFDKQQINNLKSLSKAKTVLETENKERIKAEIELKNYKDDLEDIVKARTAQLETANKELDAFAYSVSHDLRAPLRSIDGFSSAIIEDYQDKLDEEGRNYLQRIRIATQRMGQLIDDMLKLSRLTRAEMHWDDVELSAMIRKKTEELKESDPGRNVEFTVTDHVTVNGDPNLLKAMIDNLMDNAWKFTSRTDRATIEFGSSQQNGRLVYYIRDSGAGFDPAYKNKLFGAFQRLHKSDEFPGTGIGLATVQRIIHRHGGKVWAESEEGKGATFYFTLN